MKKIYAVILTVFIMLSSCGFDLIFEPRVGTPTPQPKGSENVSGTGESLLSFVRRLFGADKTGPAKITAGSGAVSHTALIAGIVCAVLLAAAVYFLVIRRKTENRAS